MPLNVPALSPSLRSSSHTSKRLGHIPSPTNNGPLPLIQRSTPRLQLLQRKDIHIPRRTTSTSKTPRHRVRRRVGQPSPAHGQVAALPGAGEHAEAEQHLGDGDEDADGDEDDDDPGDGAHLGVGDAVAEDLGEVEEDAAPLVEYADAPVDLEVLAHGDVEGVQGRFRFPEEIGDVEYIGR